MADMEKQQVQKYNHEPESRAEKERREGQHLSAELQVGSSIIH